MPSFVHAVHVYRFQAYVYDLRSSSYLHKLEKFSDTVLSVSFNPATPEVRTFLNFVAEPRDLLK